MLSDYFDDVECPAVLDHGKSFTRDFKTEVAYQLGWAASHIPKCT